MRPQLRPTGTTDSIGLRTVVIVMVACVVGTAAGTLTYISDSSLAQALLAACTAVGGTANLLNQLMYAPRYLPGPDEQSDGPPNTAAN